MNRFKRVSVKKLSARKRCLLGLDSVRFAKKYSLKVSAKEVGSSGFTDVKVESDLCPFDGLSCAMVGSCDDVLNLVMGFDCREGGSCDRAVVKAHR